MATLKEYLERNNELAEYFAARAGVSASIISRLINGKTPSLATALKIIDATKGEVTPQELLGLPAPRERRRQPPSKGSKKWPKTQKSKR